MKLNLIHPQNLNVSEKFALKILDDYDKGLYSISQTDVDKIRKIIDEEKSKCKSKINR